MFGKILGSGQLGKLASFVSPAFFDVLPARQLFRRAKQLVGQSRDPALFRKVVSERAALLEATMPQISLSTQTSAASSGLLNDGPVTGWRSAQIAELYFRQLYSDSPTLLDLRAAAFSTRAQDALVWSPAPWIAEWSADFIQPLREIYSGFYTHDDTRFRQGLAALSLSHSEDLFREQFGADQKQVAFEVRAFIDVFHRVFERCKSAKTHLHPDFLPLGIYLAALYDHEQELAVKVDVASAFARATSRCEHDVNAGTGAV
ncbi:MAG: hypothetical protein RL701_4686 [Pseudomonadota bacterium]|jgi:hypothetical protein